MSNIKVISQYIKDLSFETPNSPEIYLNERKKPDISLSIDIDAKKIANEIFEITLKITADASEDKKKIFICEVSYGGLFALQNIEEGMVEQVLLVYCPNLLFPFIRKLIANLTIDSGFPPLMIDPIDFADLYSKRKTLAESSPISNTKN